MNLRPNAFSGVSSRVEANVDPVESIPRKVVFDQIVAKEPNLGLSSSSDLRQTLAGQQVSPPPSSGALEISAQGTELPPLDQETGASNPGQLTPEEQQQVDELKRRDAEVRRHEQAHLAAAGSYALGGAQYEYQTGPDGKPYAIGGHVSLDTSKAGSPEATIQKAQQIQRAAMAPADPSPQDIKVAGQAAQMELEARRELAEEQSGNEDETPPAEGIESRENPESSSSSDVPESTGSESEPESDAEQFDLKDLFGFSATA